MRRKKTITLANKPTYQGYSYGFKVAIVERIENGQLSQNQENILIRNGGSILLLNHGINKIIYNLKSVNHY